MNRFNCTYASSADKYEFIDCLKETRQPNGLTLNVVTKSGNIAVMGSYLKLNKETLSHFIKNFQVAWIA